MISNSVTHLWSYTNSAIADIASNSTPISPETPRECWYCRVEHRSSMSPQHWAPMSLHWALMSPHKEGKLVYGQEPPSGESTTTECGFNYQLLAVITEVAQWGAPSCSQPQPATDHGVRDCRSNWLVAPPTLHRAVPPELHVLHTEMRAANHKTCFTESAANVRLQNARPTHCRCCHSGYNVGASSANVSALSADLSASNGKCSSVSWYFTIF